jgi:hypothetical protein
VYTIIIPKNSADIYEIWSAKGIDLGPRKRVQQFPGYHVDGNAGN